MVPQSLIFQSMNSWIEVRETYVTVQKGMKAKSLFSINGDAMLIKEVCYKYFKFICMTNISSVDGIINETITFDKLVNRTRFPCNF